MNKSSTNRDAEAGFTLIELLVAAAVTGIISASIFALMSQTSDSFRLADSSAATLDSARFALDRVETQLKNAGSLSTVDSRDDPYVQPKPDKKRSSVSNGSCDISDEATTPRRIAGLVSYDAGYEDSESGNSVEGGWQDYADDVIPEDIMEVNSGDGETGYTTDIGTDGDYQPEFDGLVVMGAYDFPTSFEISDVDADSDYGGCGSSEGLVKATPRGTYQLAKMDPFDTSANPPSSYPKTALENSTEQRLIRIMDQQGYSQFARICGATLNGDNELELGFTDLLHFKRGTTTEGNRWGLEPCTQQTGDASYRASLLDAYWLRVRQDPDDPVNFQLVRHRLDAGGLATSSAQDSDDEQDWTGLNPWSHAVDKSDPVVIANRVVNFEIWFDCADPNDDTEDVIDGESYHADWDVPDGEGADGEDEPTNCLRPGDPDPARARAVHVRLSMRSANERGDLQHVPYPQGTERMQTFDIDPDARGAARVVTIQYDMELTNYASRNIVDTSAP